MLRSHVELHLTPSATLVGSRDLSLYQRDAKMPYRNINRALIYADDCDFVAVTGEGTIDGDAAAVRAGWGEAQDWWQRAEAWIGRS